MSERMPDQDSVPPSGFEPGKSRVAWREHRRQVRVANRARKRAEDRLIAEHRDRWDEIYAVEAEAEGVVPARKARTDGQRASHARGQWWRLNREDERILAEVEPVHPTVEHERAWIAWRIVQLEALLSRVEDYQHGD